MKALFSLLIMAAVSSLIGADAESSETTPPASESAETTPHPPPALVLQFLGPEAAPIIAKAERVEAFRLAPSDEPLEPGDREVSGYRIIATGQAKGKEFAARLAALLLDERNYGFKGPSKICKPEPTVAFRLWHQRQHADVVLCFECTMLQVNPEVYFDDFDPMRAELVKLAKAAFPRDPVIQKLTDTSPFPIDSSLPPKPPGTGPKSR